MIKGKNESGKNSLADYEASGMARKVGLRHERLGEMPEEQALYGLDFGTWQVADRNARQLIATMVPLMVIWSGVNSIVEPPQTNFKPVAAWMVIWPSLLIVASPPT